MLLLLLLLALLLLYVVLVLFDSMCGVHWVELRGHSRYGICRLFTHMHPRLLLLEQSLALQSGCLRTLWCNMWCLIKPPAAALLV